ncbi:MAG: isopentenyl phosphate kinase family protein [Candidatus Lokiarchaeota archaeon]|nr:isopentenyl phosphate kinase family protein [Candidatus Lokiarchaeota archaeon]
MDESFLKLNIKEEIILLKLGGSLLTEKNRPFSIRKAVVKNAVQQVIDANVKLILIHGGGSFGHPLAKEYNIIKGLDLSIPNQILGLVKTHQSMNKFNNFLIDLFLDDQFPVLSIQSSTIFIKNLNKIITNSIDAIETALDLNILPILYGDIILDIGGSFSIISGDQIIFELCKNLKKYDISKVIFTMETDGLYVKDENDSNKYKLVEKCKSDELDSLDLADMGQKIDVTGGIKGKLDSIKKICKYGIPVQLINGLEKKYIYKSLKSQKINCTHVIK